MATRALKTVEDELNARDKERKAKPNGVVNIHGREYQTVAYRVQQFREANPDLCLTTEIVDRDAECVVVKASISHPGGPVLATGHAEEYRKASQINRTSALENAETSAIGRALAALGWGGTEFATANEVQNAIHQQSQPEHPSTGETPPNKRVTFDGPYTCPTQLRTAAKEFVRTLNSMGDLAEFVAWSKTDDVKEFVKQLKRDMPDWWMGGPSVPADFVPLEILVSQKKRDLEQIDELNNREGINA